MNISAAGNYFSGLVSDFDRNYLSDNLEPVVLIGLITTVALATIKSVGDRKIIGAEWLLDAAARNGNVRLAKIALMGIWDKHAVNTALELAVSHGHLEVFRELLRVGGIDMIQRDELLSLTVSHGHLEVVQALLGGIWNSTIQYDKLLRLAASHGHPEIVQELLRVGGINVSQVSRWEADIWLMRAAGREALEVVQELLRVVEGIDVIQRNKLLRSAAERGCLEVIRELLRVEGIEVNLASIHGETALILAAASGHTEVVRVLLAVDGIDVNHVNGFGSTALMRAVGCGHLEIARLILKKYLEINEKIYLQYRLPQLPGEITEMIGEFSFGKDPFLKRSFGFIDPFKGEAGDELFAAARSEEMRKFLLDAREGIQKALKRNIRALMLGKKRKIEISKKGLLEQVRDIFHMQIST